MRACLLQKENSSKIEVLSHWHPNLTINYVVDQTPWTEGMVPSPLDQREYARILGYLPCEAMESDRPLY